MALADRTESAAEQDIRHVDVLIVGAGISGIGAAARLERDRPGTSYAILEARQAIGGTWDLFRFPGVRSDTDIFTYAFPFKPWPHDTSMGDGEHIRAYLRETASEHGIEPHIHFGTKVLGAAWSSDATRWTVRAEREGAPEEWTCSFLLLCTGYYDYEDGFLPHFEGVEDYEGAFVIPQHWPEDLDHRDKRVVVIGSGATTVTLIPALARDAERVTMLQRSPSYIATLPRIDPLATFVRRWLPASLAHRLLRLKNILIWQGLYVFSRRAPAQARRLFRWLALRHIANPEFVDTHFRPRYEPWDQRVCLAPDGDIFKAIRAGKASVVTDRIDCFVPAGIRLVSGDVLEADIVVAATGLVLKPFGGLELEVDGERIDVAKTVAYRSVMLAGVPNLAFCFGYINISWTLRSDMAARFVVQLLDHMDRHGYASAAPVLEDGQERRPFITDLNAGYVERGIDRFPDQGERDPWLVSHNYMRDFAALKRRSVTEHMEFARREDARAAGAGRRERSVVVADPS